MVSKTINRVLVYWVAGAVILFDQWTKQLVRQNLAVGESWSPWPWLTPYARILHIENTGAAFGIFQNLGPLFTVIGVVVSIVIIYYTVRLPAGQWLLRFVLGLQLGGALGNLVDRLLFGPVTDFVSVGTFAIFNVSDASISIGVALLLVMMWREARHRPAATDLPPAEPADLGEPTA